MPFAKIDVKKTIENALDNDSELKQIWEESRTNYIAGILFRKMVRRIHQKVSGEFIIINKEK